MHAAVIGAGIAGASAAYRLAAAGARVTLIDRADPGAATPAGAGIVAPGTSLRDLPAYLPLAAPAVRFYPEVVAELADDGEGAPGYEPVGLLFLATDPAEVTRLDAVEALVRQRLAAGVPNIGALRRLDGAEARALFPPLADVPAALHLRDAARVNGAAFRDALVRAARRRGAELCRGTAHPVRAGDRAAAVAIDGETLAIDALVLAPGAWAAPLAAALGLALPIEPQRGQILHLDLLGEEEATGHWPIVEGFHSYYLLAFPSGRVVAGATRETGSGFDVRLTAAGTHQVLTQALRLAPGLGDATVAEWRIGLRPATPDGYPILGPAPGLANVALACGFGPSGLSLGPFAGALAADLLLGRPLPQGLDLAPYRAERFQALGVGR